MPKTAICLTLKASDRLRGLLIAGHVLPVCLFSLYFPLPLSVAFGILMLGLLIFYWWRLGLPDCAGNIRQLLATDDGWILILNSGQKIPVALLSNSGFRGFWLWLYFVDGAGKGYEVFVLRWDVELETFRRLRVCLRLRHIPKKA